jgi:hypothetical protein
MHLGEGCSSTAFGGAPTLSLAVWGNPTIRGSANDNVGAPPAVP